MTITTVLPRPRPPGLNPTPCQQSYNNARFVTPLINAGGSQLCQLIAPRISHFQNITANSLGRCTRNSCLTARLPALYLHTVLYSSIQAACSWHIVRWFIACGGDITISATLKNGRGRKCRGLCDSYQGFNHNLVLTTTDPLRWA